MKREKDHPQAVKGRAGSSAHENSVCGTTRSTGEQRGLLRVHLSRSSCIRPLFSITHGAPGYVFLSVMSSSLSCFSAADWTSREELLFTTPTTIHPVTPHPVTPHPVTPKPQGIVSRTLGGAGGLVKDAALYGAMTFGVGRCTSGRTCAPRTGRRRRTRSRRAPPRRYSTLCRRRHRRARRRR